MKIKITLLMLFSFLLSNCSSDDNGKKVEEKKVVIEFKKKEQIILIEQELDLMYELVVSNVDLSELIWNSSDSEIVSVDKGLIKTKKIGEVMVTVKIRNTDKTAALKVIVSKKNIYFKQKEVLIDANKSKTLDLNEFLILENVDKKEVFWHINDTETISVENGIVTANNDGSIYVEAILDGRVISDYILVIVKGIGITFMSITSKPYDDEIRVGDTYKYDVYTVPYQNDLTSLVWSSSNPEIATVNNLGEVYAKSAGVVTITVKAVTGVTAKVETRVITNEVTFLLTQIQSTWSGNRVIAGENYQISVSVRPFDTDISSIEFISSDPTLATVDDKGMIKTVKDKRGKVTITARAKTSPFISSDLEIELVSAFVLVKTVVYLSGKVQGGVVSGDATFKVEGTSGDYKISQFKVFNKQGTLLFKDLETKDFYYSRPYSYYFNLDKTEKPYVTYTLEYDKYIEHRKEELVF